MTAIMVTHDVDEAVYLSDKVVVMTPRPGRITGTLDIKLARPRARSSEDFLHPDADFEDLDTALSAEDVAAAGVTLPAGRTAAQIDGVYKATKDGEEIGYCVQVEPKGFGGNLTMIVGINADGTVAGAKVTSHAETPGLGAKSQADPNWITQFAGQTADGQLKVAKDGGTINAITGAT